MHILLSKRALLCFIPLFCGFMLGGCGQTDESMNKPKPSRPITQIWLTFKTNDASHLEINWHSHDKGPSEVYYRIGDSKRQHILEKEETTLHHVEIPFKKEGVSYHYQVITNNEKSQTFTIKGFPTADEAFRAVVVGDWNSKNRPDFSQIFQDNPYLLLTVGDNVPNLYNLCREGNKDCIKPYLKLIDSYPKLFATIPFMPVLGNHDKQIRKKRKNNPPPYPVYDTTATAYRTFFALPGDEWKWHFSIPNHGISFIALDINHHYDFGTIWQSCHNFLPGSLQLKWYQKTIDNSNEHYIITLMNEKNQAMRNVDDGVWQRLFQKGTAVITGFGYFQERAEVNGFPYFNTSLRSGQLFADKYSKMIKDIGGYMLLTFKKEKLEIKMKTIHGEVLDKTSWK